MVLLNTVGGEDRWIKSQYFCLAPGFRDYELTLDYREAARIEDYAALKLLVMATDASCSSSSSSSGPGLVPGWYCVADTDADPAANCTTGPKTVIEVLSGDDTSELIVCSGPHNTESEANVPCAAPSAPSCAEASNPGFPALELGVTYRFALVDVDPGPGASVQPVSYRYDGIIPGEMLYLTIIVTEEFGTVRAGISPAVDCTGGSDTVFGHTPHCQPLSGIYTPTTSVVLGIGNPFSIPTSGTFLLSRTPCP